MIGKIIAITIFALILIAYTGVNASPYYQELVTVRNKAQPVADNLVENVLTEVAKLGGKMK